MLEGDDLARSAALFYGIRQAIGDAGMLVNEVHESLVIAVDPNERDRMADNFLALARNFGTIPGYSLPTVLKAAAGVLYDLYPPAQPWGLAVERVQVDGNRLVMTGKPREAISKAPPGGVAADAGRYRVLEAMLDEPPADASRF